MSVPQEATPLAAGERLEGYEIDGLLARGRFTFSYTAHAVAGGMPVVINEFLPHDFAIRDGVVLRARDIEDRNALRWWMRSFLDRAAQLSALSHIGLVKVLKNFEANGTGYYVTEASSGETLATLLEREGTLSEPQLRRILASVLGGLGHAHAAGLLHRDVRPQNIWLRPNGTAALADFGILRAPIRFKSKTLTTAAAPPYSAPEEYQLNGSTGAWSDIYALGGIAYRAVSGLEPVDARERERGVSLALVSQVARVRASDTLLSGIDASLQLIPAERPQSVAAWSELLQLEAGNTVYTPASAQAGPQPPARSASGAKRTFLWLVPVVIVALAAAGFFLFKPAPINEPLPAISPASAKSSDGAVVAETPAAPEKPVEASVKPSVPAAPVADTPASSGDLDKLVQELMARDKKAQAEIKEQQQRLLDLQKQALKNGTAKTPAPPNPSSPSLPKTDSTSAAAAPAAADSPASPAESEAEKRSRELEAEIERLRAQQAQQQAAQKPEADSNQKKADVVSDQDTAVRAAAVAARQKAVIARARQACRIPAMDLSASGDLTYDTAMRVAGAEKLGSGAIRLPEVTLSDGRSETFLITPDSCARIEH